MSGYKTNIEEDTLTNTNFRKVLFTGKFLQLVVMSLKPGEEIGNEVHETVDQLFRVEEGNAQFVLGEEKYEVGVDEVFIVPAGNWHNVINLSDSQDLKLYTVYTPPNHPDGTIHATKEEADEAEKHEH